MSTGMAGKRSSPNTSFEDKGPATPGNNILSFDIGSRMAMTPEDAEPDLSAEDTITIERLMPAILRKMRPQINQAANLAAESALEKYREEIRAKDQLIEQLQTEVNELRARIDPLAAQVGPTTAPIPDAAITNVNNSCTVALEALEQYTRRNCLVIRNVPIDRLQGKTTDQYVIDLALSINVVIVDSDICRSHQLGKPFNDRIRIIVRFVRHNVKEKLYKAKKNLKPFPDKVVISESLTFHRREIFKRVDALRYEKKLTNTWTDDGKVLFKTDKATKTHRIPVEKYAIGGDYSLVNTFIMELRDQDLRQLELLRRQQDEQLRIANA